MNQAGPPQHCKSVHSSSQGEGLDNVTHPAAVLAAQTAAAMAASAATEMTPQQRLQTPPPSGTCILPPAPAGYSYLYDRDGLKLWNPATRELKTVVMTTPQPPQQWIGTCPSREHATQVGNQALPAQSQAPLPNPGTVAAASAATTHSARQAATSGASRGATCSRASSATRKASWVTPSATTTAAPFQSSAPA